MRKRSPLMVRSLVVLSLFLCCLVPAGCNRPGGPAPQDADRAKERLYAGYAFDAPGALDLGVQPLGVPQSSVSELICRDRTLAAQLQADGLTVKPFPFYKGADIDKFLAQGKLEAGFLGDLPTLTAAARGDVVIVALVKQGFSSIVAARPMLVRELKGKRIGTGLGSTAHFTLLNALENEGLSERDVKVVGMEVDDMAQALARGEIDAFCAWEPTPVLALAAHPEFYLVHKGLNFSFLCLRRDFAAAHPDQARYLAAAVARACLWMREPGTLERAAGWIRNSASNFQGRPYFLTAEQTAALTSSDLLKVPAAPQIPDRLLAENGLLFKEFSHLKARGKIPPDLPWARVRAAFDTGLLRGVLADPEAYRLGRFDYRTDDGQQGGK